MAPTRDDILDVLRKVIQATQTSDFEEMHTAFFQEHAVQFDSEEENKLAYTEIHNKYVQSVEAEMLKVVELDEIHVLTDNIEILSHDEGVVKIYGETIRLDSARNVDFAGISTLLLCKDFQIFKAEMLHTKDFSVSSSARGSGEKSDTPLSRICVDLDNFENWTTVDDRGWLKVSHETANGGRLWRTDVVLDITQEDWVDLMFNGIKNGVLHNYAEFIALCECIEHTPADGEIPENAKAHWTFESGGLGRSILALLIGKGVTVDANLYRDRPSQGVVAIEILAGSGSSDRLQSQNFVIQHIPDQPGKCRLTVCEEWHSMVPMFMKKAAYIRIFPMMIQGTLKAYREYKQNR